MNHYFGFMGTVNVYFQWEFEKWKFENRNQVMLFSHATGKALRIKPDGTVDGLGEPKDRAGECSNILMYYDSVQI